MNRFADVLKKIFGVFGAFLVGRTLIALVVTGLSWLGFWAVACPLPFLFALLVGLLVVIPLLPMIVVIIAAVVTLVTGNDAPRWLAAFGVFGIGTAVQIVEAYVLTPAILGKKLELGFFTVIGATVLFGAIFGVVGVLFAVPLAAIAKILGKEVILPFAPKPTVKPIDPSRIEEATEIPEDPKRPEEPENPPSQTKRL